MKTIKTIFSGITCVLFFIVFLSGSVSGQVNYSTPPEFARKVYNDLYKVMNDNKTIKPKLVLSNDPKEIATYRPKDRLVGEATIILGENFISLVRNFGKDSSNALAHVLGHEMAHVFLHQLKIGLIGSGYASEELSQQLKRQKNTMIDSLFEREADEHSAFYCHIAGYSTTGVGEIVLDSIYKRFNLSDPKLKKYPPIAERKEIVKNSERQMQALKLMFDDGVLALMAQNYDMAKPFFRTISDERFKSREIYNNLGLAYLMDAIHDLDTLEYPYVFPLQIDISTNLDLVNHRGISFDTHEKLKVAIETFDKAIDTKLDYSMGLLNKAIAQFILEDYNGMSLTILLAKHLKDPEIESQIKVLEAIHKHKTGDTQVAIEELKSMAAESIIAKKNVEKITGVSTNKTVGDYFSEIINSPLPKHNYSSESQRQGREMIKAISSGNDFILKVSSDDEYSSRQWIYSASSKRPRIIIYQKNAKVSYNEKEWNSLKGQADSYFKFSELEFIRIKSFIFKRQGNDVEILIVN